jgi:hypothetical protein
VPWCAYKANFTPAAIISKVITGAKIRVYPKWVSPQFLSEVMEVVPASTWNITSGKVFNVQTLRNVSLTTAARSALFGGNQYRTGESTQRHRDINVHKTVLIGGGVNQSQLTTANDDNSHEAMLFKAYIGNYTKYVQTRQPVRVSTGVRDMHPSLHIFNMTVVLVLLLSMLFTMLLLSGLPDLWLFAICDYWRGSVVKLI